MPKPTKVPPPAASASTASGGSSASVATTGENITVLEWGEGDNDGKVRQLGGDWRDPTMEEMSDRLASLLQWGDDADPETSGKVRLPGGEWHEPSPEELATKPAPLPPLETGAVDPAAAADLVRLGGEIGKIGTSYSAFGMLADIIRRQTAEFLRLTGHHISPELVEIDADLENFVISEGDPAYAAWLKLLREEARKRSFQLDLSPESAIDWEELFEEQWTPAQALDAAADPCVCDKKPEE